MYNDTRAVCDSPLPWRDPKQATVPCLPQLKRQSSRPASLLRHGPSTRIAMLVSSTRMGYKDNEAGYSLVHTST